MKKINILSVVTIVAALVLSSCGNTYKEKTVELKNQTDSLNYAFGYANGCGIKDYYFKTVKNEDEAIKVFVDELVKSYESTAETEETDQLYQLGLQIGSWFKKQKEEGLFDKDSNLDFDYKKVKEGLIDAVNRGDNGEEGITIQEAEEMINNEISRIQEEKQAKELEALEEIEATEEVAIVE